MCICFPTNNFVEIKNNTLHIKGTDKKDNIEVTQNSNSLEVKINDEVQIIPSDNLQQLDVNLLDGDDSFEFNDNRVGSGLKNLSLNIDGGKGDDLIISGNGNDIIHGSEGDDEIYGEGGKNVLYGDEGNDFLIGDLSAKRKTKLIGGEGYDTTNKGFWKGQTVLKK